MRRMTTFWGIVQHPGRIPRRAHSSRSCDSRRRFCADYLKAPRSVRGFCFFSLNVQVPDRVMRLFIYSIWAPC
ncbi:uncharacterized protein CLUP02_07490 [Colletotrichum lupini]|uniref:Uncharacterized protein n=1 Tax=Colletotrichum lupini TaxID=145971 RepID=A0A9Q8SR30_9PEZI|nr:uncharacterized protein CLUP02_07490 [Colletotrichum lupini]UQC82004.1 hypothetical protein CLUP02_07490 [Colletotrichum lupini]